jgi:hypothetical protein
MEDRLIAYGVMFARALYCLVVFGSLVGLASVPSLVRDGDVELLMKSV